MRRYLSRFRWLFYFAIFLSLVIAALWIEGIFVHRYWYPQTLVFTPSQPSRDYFGASVAINHDFFGASVAIDGDTLAVAASDIGANYTVGAVYVYVRNDSAWQLQAKLVEENVEKSVGFAQSVGISGNTIVVSTDQPALENPVYVYERQGSVWRQQAKLELPKISEDQERYNRFKDDAVAIDGNTIIVGAEGVAYLYTRDISGGWNYETMLVSPDRSNSSSGNSDHCYLGSSISISGDAIVVGGACTNIFVRHPTTRQWTYQASLLPKVCQPSQPCEIGGFGYSVAIDRDTVIVGTASPLPGPFQYCVPNSGDSAYIFERTPGTSIWKQTAVLQPRGSIEKFLASRCGFGEQVAISEDTAIVVGVRFRAEPHLFKRNPQTGEWQYQAETAVDPQMAYRHREYNSRRSTAISFPDVVVGDTSYSRNKESRFDSGVFYLVDVRSPKLNANLSPVKSLRQS